MIIRMTKIRKRYPTWTVHESRRTEHIVRPDRNYGLRSLVTIVYILNDLLWLISGEWMR